jgi:hypothetical protein
MERVRQMAQATKQERAGALEYLREALQAGLNNVRAGDRLRVYVVVTTVARSGMSRRMRFYVNDGRNMIGLTHNVAKVCGWPINDDGARIDGAGMDMRWYAVDVMLHHAGIGIGANDVEVVAL